MNRGNTRAAQKKDKWSREIDVVSTGDCFLSKQLINIFIGKYFEFEK